MDRFDPFVKYADVYGEIINWEDDPMNRPSNQHKYFFSDGKTYYEQICKMLRLMSVFKQAFNTIYNNEDEIKSAWDSFVDNISATATQGDAPDVTVTWTDESVEFNFTMPPGVPGPQGVSITSIAFNPDYTMTIYLSNGQSFTSGSIRGPEGPAGSGMQLLDVYPTLADLQTAHPTGSPGDAYQIGTGGSYVLYIWSVSQSAWANAGSLGSVAPSDVTPSMNGTASAGSSIMYSRGDHVHPNDVTKLDKSSTNGVYAVNNGSQIMIPASSSASANAIARYDNGGDIHANGLSLDADADISGDVSADMGIFESSVSSPLIIGSTEIRGGEINGTDITASGDISGTNITASGTITGNDISITNNTILNSNKLSGIAGSTNAYQVLATVGANMNVLGLGADLSAHTPSVKFMGTKWNNSGTMSDATSEVHFTNSFKTDSTSYGQSRIGLAPATASVLGGVKIGSGLTVESDGTLNRNTIDLLWENSLPSSDFAAQSITVNNIRNYKLVLVMFNIYKSAIYNSSCIAIVGGGSVLASSIRWDGNSNITAGRVLTANASGTVSFQNAYRLDTYGIGTGDSGYMIPVAIYGMN